MTKQTLQNIQNSILVGDSWELAKQLPDEAFQCIVTSPPYFQHRTYSIDETTKDKEFGRESSPSEYIDKLAILFEELKRTLRPDGTLWLNLGDTYRENELLGIPWRLAFALKDKGWILRSEIIWNKTNAMPSSVKNRPTTSHETIFLFAKQLSYYYDADSIREAHVTFSENSKMKGGRNHFGKAGSTPENGKNKGNSNLHNSRWDQAFHPLGRNKRTVWDIALGKFRDAHFAVFPPKLAETCILAGTKTDDVVLDPFMGSGTTALVARELGRHYVGLELVSEYATIARKRLENIQPYLIL